MNPYQKGNSAYKKSAVNTNDQGTLILMLYDGTIRFLKIASKKISTNDLEGAHQSISKAKNIISELMTSLNPEQTGRVGTSLKSLYVYMFNRLIDANIQKKSEYVDEVCELMAELREGWQAVINKKKEASNQNTMKFNNRNEMKPLNIRG